MPIHIALIVDASQRYAHVWGEAPSWDKFCDQLEDIGCEVVEEQTEDWDGSTKEEIAEDCVSVHQLLTGTDFIPYD
jgi:hypothetical protein